METGAEGKMPDTEKWQYGTDYVRAATCSII